MLTNCFLICKNTLPILNNYNKISLDFNNTFIFFSSEEIKKNYNSTTLLYSKNKINIKKLKNKNNQNIFVIGIYFFSNKNYNDSVFNELNESNINNILSAIVGNYIVIYNNHIYMDCTGQYGIEYMYSNNECYISNNISVFKELDLTLIENQANINSHITNSVDTKRYTSYNYDYYIPPETQFSNVKSLMPSQIISLDGKIKYNNLFYNSYNNSLTNSDSIIKLCAECLQTIIKNIYNQCKLTNNTIYVPLTSGYDSRVILAACKSINIPIKTFTIARDRSLSKSDKNLPPILAKLCMYPHFYINVLLKKSNINNELLEKWNYIIGRNHTGVDREYYIRDVYSFANNGDYILTGHGFELSTYYYKNTNITKWDIKDDININDRLYFEGRLGGWLKYITSSYTVEKNIHRIYPINCRDILCNFLNLPNSIRKDAKNKLNKELIKIFYPQLNNYNFN